MCKTIRLWRVKKIIDKYITSDITPLIITNDILLDEVKQLSSIIESSENVDELECILYNVVSTSDFCRLVWENKEQNNIMIRLMQKYSTTTKFHKKVYDYIYKNLEDKYEFGLHPDFTKSAINVKLHLKYDNSKDLEKENINFDITTLAKILEKLHYKNPKTVALNLLNNSYTSNDPLLLNLNKNIIHLKDKLKTNKSKFEICINCKLSLKDYYLLKNTKDKYVLEFNSNNSSIELVDNSTKVHSPYTITLNKNTKLRIKNTQITKIDVYTLIPSNNKIDINLNRILLEKSNL